MRILNLYDSQQPLVILMDLMHLNVFQFDVHIGLFRVHLIVKVCKVYDFFMRLPP